MYHDYVQCPECFRRMNLDDKAKSAIDSNQIREWRITCSSGHNFSAFQGLLAVRMQPNHYNVFWPIQGMESGQVQMRVGEWKMIKIEKSFDELDEIKTIYFQEGGGKLSGVRTNARFTRTTPKEFCLMTSGLKEEWGQKIKINWIVYGITSEVEIEAWQENLIYAARQLLNANYRPSVIQSAVSVESYVFDFVTKYLKDIARWDHQTIKDYVEGSSINSLSVQGLIKIFIQETIGIKIPKDVFAEWMRLKNMRDALAHGDLIRYRNLKSPGGLKFPSDKERAEFAYSSAVRFIYEVRYPS